MRNSFRGGLHGILCKVGVTVGRLHVAVTEELSDHRQAFAQGERPRSVSVVNVMNAHVVQSGRRADALLGPVEVGHVRARLGARNDPGIAWFARQGREHVDHRRR